MAFTVAGQTLQSDILCCRQ